MVVRNRGRFKRYGRRQFKKKFGRKAYRQIRRLWDKKAEILTLPFNKQNNIVPPITRTKLHMQCSVDIPNTTVINPLIATFPINGCVSVLTTSAAANSIGALGTVFGQGVIANANLRPAGYSNICGPTALYYAYRILGVKITVTVNPEALVDGQYVLLMAADTNAALASTITTGSDAPFSSKVAQCQVGSPIRSRQVSMFYKMHEIMGLTPQQYMSSPSFQAGYNANPPVIIYGGIILQSLANPTVGTSSHMGVTIHFKYYMQFENPNIGDIPDT